MLVPRKGVSEGEEEGDGWGREGTHQGYHTTQGRTALDIVWEKTHRQERTE